MVDSVESGNEPSVSITTVNFLSQDLSASQKHSAASGLPSELGDNSAVRRGRGRW